MGELGISSIKFAVRRNKTNMFLTCGMSPGFWQDGSVVDSHHLYETRPNAVDHIEWMRQWAKYPETGPKVKLDAGETFSIVRVRVDLSTTDSELY